METRDPTVLESQETQDRVERLTRHPVIRSMALDLPDDVDLESWAFTTAALDRFQAVAADHPAGVPDGLLIGDPARAIRKIRGRLVGIEKGDRVISHHFPTLLDVQGERGMGPRYVVGPVVEVLELGEVFEDAALDRPYEAHDCPRYVIRVDVDVWGGRVRKIKPRAFVFPPVNGTRVLGPDDVLCHGVERVDDDFDPRA